MEPTWAHLSLSFLLCCDHWRVEGWNRRKSKPIFAKSLRAVISQIRKRKVHEKSKPMASLSLIPFPFALHSLSSSRLAVTHGNTNQNKTKTKGRRVSYTNSSQVHKVSPWATCSKGWVSSKTVSILFLFLLPQTRGRQHTSIGCVCPLQTSTSHHVWVRRSSKLLSWLTCVIIRRQITPDRTMKSTPGSGQVETTLTLSNCNNSVHTAVQGYFGSTKIVSSNSFSDVQSRQNRS